MWKSWPSSQTIIEYLDPIIFILEWADPLHKMFVVDRKQLVSEISSIL